MVAHFPMRTFWVNQEFLFVEGIWLHRKSRQIRFFPGNDLFSLYVRNMFWATILYKYHASSCCQTSSVTLLLASANSQNTHTLCTRSLVRFTQNTYNIKRKGLFSHTYTLQYTRNKGHLFRKEFPPLTKQMYKAIDYNKYSFILFNPFSVKLLSLNPRLSFASFSFSLAYIPPVHFI